MQFKKDVSPELRKILLVDLDRYTSAIQMTEEEHIELCKWVQDGNSPYDNGWYISSENGTSLDFVNAMRIIASDTNTGAKF